MSSDILTCRCRHCGKTFPYLRSDAGAQGECPECNNSVLLPGRLASVATKRKSRVKSVPGLILEIGGFLLLFWWPFGSAVAPILIIIGYRHSTALRCSNCEQCIEEKATRCPKCRAAFASD